MSSNCENTFIKGIIRYFNPIEDEKRATLFRGSPRAYGNDFYGAYIMPPIPPYPPPGGIAGAAGSSFGFSATRASVVNMSAATDAAF